MRVEKKCLAAVFIATGLAAAVHADSFGVGEYQFTMDFATIGHAGNAPGRRGYGTVDYEYRIGKYEVSINQFNKARAADARISNGNEGYWNQGTRTVGPDAPASKVSWYEAAKFSNWLTTGDAHIGVYQFDNSGSLTGFDRTFRNADGMAYVLPTLDDEWYKAACFKPDGSGYSVYANGSNSSAALTHGTANGWNYHNNGYATQSPNLMWEVDFGGEEQNGTHNMMGNITEWNETSVEGVLSARQGYHGGNYGHRHYSLSPLATYAGGTADPTASNDVIGFRVAAIPEPMSAVLILQLFPLLLIRRTLNNRMSGNLHMQLVKLCRYVNLKPADRDRW